jgi:hypothetical protein
VSILDYTSEWEVNGFPGNSVGPRSLTGELYGSYIALASGRFMSSLEIVWGLESPLESYVNPRSYWWQVEGMYNGDTIYFISEMTIFMSLMIYFWDDLSVTHGWDSSFQYIGGRRCLLWLYWSLWNDHPILDLVYPCSPYCLLFPTF